MEKVVGQHIERGSEHWRDFKDEKEDSHMWKHVSTEHADKEKVTFSMKVMKSRTTQLISTYWLNMKL